MAANVTERHMAGIGQEQEQRSKNIHRLAQLLQLEFLWLQKTKQKKAHRGPLVQEADLVLNPLSAVMSQLTAESGFTVLAIFKQWCVGNV